MSATHAKPSGTRRLAALALVGLAALAACSTINNPSTTGANGQVLIRFADGQNCWNQCVTYDAGNHRVEAPGFKPAKVPGDIDLSDGYVTEAEFERLYRASRRTRPEGGIDN